MLLSASQMASKLRGAMRRDKVLSLAKTYAIGLKSRLWDERWRRPMPAAARHWWMTAT